MRNEQGYQKRTITFDPTDISDGKNTCNMPGIMNIPVINDANGNAIAKNDFITKEVISRYNKMIDIKENAAKDYQNVLTEIENAVEQITDADGANHFLAHIGEYKQHGNSVIIKARDLFSKKVKALGLVYDKAAKKYTSKTA